MGDRIAHALRATIGPPSAAQRWRIVVAGDRHLGGRRPSPDGLDFYGDPVWGHHLDDVNLALGNPVVDVGLGESAFR